MLCSMMPALLPWAGWTGWEAGRQAGANVPTSAVPPAPPPPEPPTHTRHVVFYLPFTPCSSFLQGTMPTGRTRWNTCSGSLPHSIG